MDSSPYAAMIVAGIVFALVALMHLLRLIYKTRIMVGEKIISMKVSVLGFVVALVLSIWMFASSTAVG